jgi:transposase
MDSDRRSAQVERLEVVDTGRRRRWSEDEKLKIVLESLQAPRQVAATARRYGVSRSLLLRWRRSFRPEPKDVAHPTGFVPAMVVAESGATPGPVGPAGSGAIEIELGCAIAAYEVFVRARRRSADTCTEPNVRLTCARSGHLRSREKIVLRASRRECSDRDFHKNGRKISGRLGRSRRK